MNRLPNLTGLRAFEAVARVGSFGKAAAELNLTSTAISHAGRKLEREIGCELFTRRPRPVRLTAEGQTLFVAVNEAFGDIGRTAETLNGKRGDEPIRLGVATAFAGRWLVPRLDRIRTAAASGK